MIKTKRIFYTAENQKVVSRKFIREFSGNRELEQYRRRVHAVLKAVYKKEFTVSFEFINNN